MSNRTHLPALDRAAALGELLRCRILRLVDDRELTVSELCSVLQLPQSTVSRHLKVLGAAELVGVRRDGTSNFYQLATGPARALWDLVRPSVDEHRLADQDDHRLAAVLAAREDRSQRFFAATATEWDELRDQLYGRRFDLATLAALVDRRLVVGDLACGTGRVADLLAPFVAEVVAIDTSPAMLAAARQRLGRRPNVRLLEGRLEDLPLPDEHLDVATMVLALHLVPDAPRVLAEAARVLRPGGRLLVVDLLPHDREDLRREMGHVRLGVEPGQLAEWLEAAGFESVDSRPITPEPEARGPALHLAVGHRPATPHASTLSDPAPSGRALRPAATT